MAIAQSTAYEEFVEFITSSPTLEQMADFRLSDTSEARISYLLEANRMITFAGASTRGHRVVVNTASCMTDIRLNVTKLTTVSLKSMAAKL